MPVSTIVTDVSADVLEKIAFGKKRANVQVDLKNDTKYALCLLELYPDVTQDDYATLATNVKAVQGIVDIELVVDHKTEAVIQADHTQQAHIQCGIVLHADPVPET